MQTSGTGPHHRRLGSRGTRFSALSRLLVFLVALAGDVRAEAPAAEPGEPDPQAVVGVLPFLEAEEANRVYIDLAKPDHSRRIRVLLDTGASMSVFTPGAAREIGIRPRRLKQDPYRRGTSLGRDLRFYIDTSTSDTASKTGWDYGLLGGSFLEHFVVELDFPGRRVRFLDPDRYRVPESAGGDGEAVLPIRVETSRPGLEILVNEKPYTVLVDTGAPPGVMLSGEMAAAAGISSKPVEGFTMGGVHLADMGTEVGVASSLRLGPFEFERVPVVVSPNGWFNQGYPGDSIIGYDVLSQFTVRIDYPRRRIWLRRDPDARMTFLGEDVAESLEKMKLLDVAAPPEP